MVPKRIIPNGLFCQIRLDGQEPVQTTVQTNTGTYNFTGTWTDDNGEKQSVDLVITIENNSEHVAEVNYDNKLNTIIVSMNLDGKTWKEKADAITDYVCYNFEYNYKYSSAYSMLTEGGGDCRALTELICDLAKKAGFAEKGKMTIMRVEQDIEM